jgi:hypothetical protein
VGRYKKGGEKLEKNTNKGKGEDKKQRRRVFLRLQGGGAVMPIPADFLKQLDWPPTITEVLVTLEAKGLSVEKFRKLGE